METPDLAKEPWINFVLLPWQETQHMTDLQRAHYNEQNTLSYKQRREKHETAHKQLCDALARRLREVLESKQVTKQHMANRVGCGVGSITRFSKGEFQNDIWFTRLAAALEVEFVLVVANPKETNA